MTLKNENVLKIRNFINNEFSDTDTYVDSFNPSTGELLVKIPDSGKKEAELAVNAANAAFKSWSQTTVAERSRLVNRIADEIEKRLDEFAVAESRDQGKPITVSKTVEIPRAIHNFRFFATSILHHKDEATQMPQVKAFSYTTRVPTGVAVLISPWNLPLYLLSWKIAPAIATGNTCVCKPSEFTSYTAYLLCECIVAAGLPAGVVNVVFGLGASVGNELCIHPNVSLISFTGGTVTGGRIRQATANQHKKLSLEMGGKNPSIIFADADLDKLMPNIGRACFQNSGQICLCSSRLYVHKDIHDRFIERLKTYANSLVIGDPLDSKTQFGPVCSKEHYNKIKSYIDIAVRNGHEIVCGETVTARPESLNPNGYYILPTVIDNVPETSELMRDEIFGPVVCVSTFENEEEVIERANNTRYGLAATVWTNDVSLAHRVAKQLQCGTTWINCFLIRDLNMPFGGFKESGMGREGYPYSIDFFTELKTICVYHG